MLAATGYSWRTETANISSDGFLCNLPEPFEPGQHLHCIIVLVSAGGTGPLYLEGEAEVVRIIVENSEPGFRIGFRLNGYHVRKNVPDAQTSWLGLSQTLPIPAEISVPYQVGA